MTWAVAGTILATVGYFGWKFTARSAYEAAEYTTVEADGVYEIREYPDLILAKTPMQFDAQGDDGSFMRLFGFISGRNEKRQKIAMTVPVFMERATGESNANMGFVVPRSVAEEGVPTPTHDQVQVSRRSGGRFAVIRFSGQLNDVTAVEQERVLRNWMASHGLIGNEDVETAGYDPPWTPGPLRRNEILIRLHQSVGSQPL